MSDSSFAATASLQGSIQSLYETATAHKARADAAQRRNAELTGKIIKIRESYNAQVLKASRHIEDIIDMLNRSQPAALNIQILSDMLSRIAYDLRSAPREP